LATDPDRLEPMAICKNCGRELPISPSGESSDLCDDCLNNNLAPVQPQVRRIVLPSRKVTQVLLGINVLVFLAMMLSGASPVNPENPILLRFGANWGPLSLGSQPWRMLASNYVHGGIIHIALNMWCLWDIGALAEIVFGSTAYLILYTLCGLGGSIASLWWHPMVVGVGASGAIFGLAGALITVIYLGHLPFPKESLKRTLRSLVMFAGYNLFFGAVVAHVDNSAHIGGLVTGLAIGALMARHLHESQEVRRRWARIVIAGFAVVLLAAFLLVKNVNGNSVVIGEALNAIQAGKVDEAISSLEPSTSRDSKDPTAFLLLGSAYLEKGDFAKAEPALQKAVALKPDFFPAQFNLGLTQLKLGKAVEATASLRAAVSIDAKSSDAQEALAEALRAQGRNDEANAAMQKAKALRNGGN
jgi:rhomboid protease GluP